jgi:hypothetical protein
VRYNGLQGDEDEEKNRHKPNDNPSQLILGKFAYDPRDGEVRFSVSVPIDENDLSYEQFQHCILAVVKTVEEYAPKLKAIAAGEKTASSSLRRNSVARQKWLLLSVNSCVNFWSDWSRKRGSEERVKGMNRWRKFD